MLSLLLALLIPSAHAIVFKDVVNPASIPGLYKVQSCDDSRGAQLVEVRLVDNNLVMLGESGAVLKTIENMSADRYGTLTAGVSNREQMSRTEIKVTLTSGRSLKISEKKAGTFDPFSVDEKDCLLER